MYVYDYSWAKDHREDNPPLNLSPTQTNNATRHCKQTTSLHGGSKIKHHKDSLLCGVV